MSVPAFAGGGWTSVKSKNFFLVGDAPEPAMRGVAIRLEQFRQAFHQLFPDLKLDSGVRTNVIVFKDSASYRPFKPKKPDGTPDEAISGYFLAADDINYITLSIDGNKGDPYRTIYHEYVHYLLRSNAGGNDLPQWLDEGIAQYYETLRFMGDQQVLLGSAPDDYLSLLRHNKLIPLKTFFTTDNVSLHEQGDDLRSLFYLQAWAVVHYLIQNDKNKAVGGLDRFFTLLGSKESPEEAFKHAFQVDYDSLEAALNAYIARPTLPTTLVTFSSKVTADSALSTSAISETQADAYLGDLLYHADRLDEAEVFLRRAVALDEPSGIAFGALASLLIRQAKFADARKLLEKAIVRDPANHLNYFNLAYTVSRENEDSSGKVSKYSPETTKIMREALERSILLEPHFAESYRLLAFVDFVNNESLDEAVSLLKKGIALKPKHQDFDILLAQILLTQDKYDEARSIAADLVKTAPDTKVRSDAETVLKTVGEYTNARLEIVKESTIRQPWMQPLIFLKRSWLTQTDLADIDRDRTINNLNIILERPMRGESRMIGVIDRVTCSGGEIGYNIKSEGHDFTMTSRDFKSLRTAVLLEGENSFQVDCGASFAKTLSVLAFRPALDAKPQLTSITFVPDFFVLKTPEELASTRTVVVEDDMLRKGSSRTVESSVNDLKPEARWAAITEKLRAPQDGETREIGVIEKINCAGKSVVVNAVSAGKKLRLFSNSPQGVNVAWFSQKASQISLACDATPLAANALLTFKRTSDEDGELKALEFVPDNFALPPQH
jgi:tetratricopeptide (TPR) repeat protein